MQCNRVKTSLHMNMYKFHVLKIKITVLAFVFEIRRGRSKNVQRLIAHVHACFTCEHCERKGKRKQGN